MPQKIVWFVSPSALTVAGVHVRAQMSNHWWWLGLPKMLGSAKVSTWRLGHAQPSTCSSDADPSRKLSGSSSTSGINCTAPSATPATAIVSSQPASLRMRTKGDGCCDWRRMRK